MAATLHEWEEMEELTVMSEKPWNFLLFADRVTLYLCIEDDWKMMHL